MNKQYRYFKNGKLFISPVRLFYFKWTLDKGHTPLGRFCSEEEFRQEKHKLETLDHIVTLITKEPLKEAFVKGDAEYNGMLEALNYALYICENRKTNPLYNESYKAGCNDVSIFIAAAKERIENEEPLRDCAVAI